MDLEQMEALLSEVRQQLQDLDPGRRRLSEQDQATRQELADTEAELVRNIRQARMTQLRQRFEQGTVTLERGVDFPQDEPQRTADSGVRGEALRTVETSPALSDEQRQVIVTAIEGADAHNAAPLARWARVAADPHYVSAFRRLLVDPLNGHRSFSERELSAYRAAQEVRAALGIGNTGGTMVPAHLDPAVILTSDGSINPMRQLARVVQIATDTWNGVSSAGVVASWKDEFDEDSDDTPTFSGPSIPTERFSAWVEFSVEYQGDAVAGESALGDLLRDSAEQLQAAGFTTGAGSASDEPQGIITGLDGTASEVSPSVAEAFSDTDPYLVQEALAPRFQARATWQAALGTLNILDLFETTNGSKLFPGVAANPGTLLRKPVHENSAMDSAADIDDGVTADNFVLLYGSIADAYVIVDRVGTQIELVSHVMGANRRPTGTRGFWLWGRTGGGVVNAAAARVLSIPTTA